jgi:hypothetical protein
MKTRVLCFLFLAASSSVQAEIKFVGYGKFPAGYRFALGDDATSANGWLAVGDEFQGYRLASFDAAREELELVRKGETLHLALPAPRVGAERRWEPERGAELGALLEDMRPKPGLHHEKLVTMEDYIAVGTIYGLVITAHTLTGDEELIEMGVPAAQSDVKNDGIIITQNFAISLAGRNGQPRRTLRIRFSYPKPEAK